MAVRLVLSSISCSGTLQFNPGLICWEAEGDFFACWSLFLQLRLFCQELQSVWQVLLRFDVIRPSWRPSLCLSCPSSVQPPSLVSCQKWFWNCIYFGKLILLSSLTLPIALVSSWLIWAPHCREVVKWRVCLPRTEKTRRDYFWWCTWDGGMRYGCISTLLKPRK